MHIFSVTYACVSMNWDGAMQIFDPLLSERLAPCRLLEILDATMWCVFQADPRLSRLANCIFKGDRYALTLPGAARVACLDRCYFSRYFRRRVGVGFQEWMNAVRVCRALEVMAAGQASNHGTHIDVDSVAKEAISGRV